MRETLQRLWVWLSVAQTPWRSAVNKQLLFMGPFVAAGLIFGSSPGAVLNHPVFNAGIGVGFITTVVVLVVPWGRIHAAWAGLIPVAGFLAVSMLRYSVNTSLVAVALLIFVPTLWLVTLFRSRGTLLAVGLTVLMVGIPVVTQEAGNIGLVDALRVLLLPLAVGQVGWFVSGLLMTVEDANERIRQETEAKLALHETALAQGRLLQNIIDSVGVGVVVVDRAGQAVYRNQFQNVLWGFASPSGTERAPETDLLEYLPNTDIPVPADQRPMQRAVAGETYSNYLVVMGEPGGEQRILSTSARQITDADGERDGAVISFTDVTFHMATAQSQSRFVSMVSHELRTPLTSIIGFLDLAREEDLPHAAQSHLEVANRNAEQLLVIVEDLLRNQKTANERISYKLGPGRLSDLVNLACDSAQAQAEAKGVALERHLAPTPASELDFARLSQVVDNLLSNAIKFTPAGGRVTVSTEVTPSTMDVVVSDTGIGMTTEEQSHLYTRFYRAGGATQGNIPGLGLGLAITRDIVQGHGGQISLSSEQGRGSTFRVSLPLPQASADQLPRADALRA